jgi:hypothetical protein
LAGIRGALDKDQRNKADIVLGDANVSRGAVEEVLVVEDECSPQLTVIEAEGFVQGSIKAVIQ